MMAAIDPLSGHVRGTSWLHRSSPIAKLAWVIAVIVVALVTDRAIPLLAIAGIGAVVAVTAGLGRPLARILVVFAPVTASIIVIQTIAPAVCAPTCTAVASIGPLTLYAEGMTHALVLVSRILAVEVVALAVLLSTHPSDLFASLARLRVPYLLNFMLAMTLQLVPVLHREVGIVLAAQRSRGMRTGFAAIVPSFVPVFVGAFERVQQLSISLESRAFGSSSERTSYRRVGFGPRDAILTAGALAFAVVGTGLGLTGWQTDGAALILPAPATTAIFLLAAAVFAAVIGAALAAIARS